MPGQASRTVMRRMTRQGPAPCISAASSSVGSMERNTAAVMMKASGARLSPCTQPMPSRLVMLNGGPLSPNVVTRNWFTSPMRGCSRNNQPMAAAKPGISRPIAIRVNSSVLARKSVRSASHAAGMPKASATTSDTNANANVSRRTE